jgi:hypothetical protein
VIARRAVFTDAKVRDLLTRFVPAADEVGRLQRGKDPECLLFQQIAEQGHYGGRTQPTNTRQGLYAATVDGRLLASINHNDPTRVAAMLKQALAAWEALPRAERVPAGWDGASERRRLEARYPSDGLALRLTSRDLPRTTGAPPRDWRAHAWNLDSVWFTAAEARSLLPAEPVAGATHTVTGAALDRLTRIALVDNVRGQTYPAPKAAVERATLTSRVTSIAAGRVTLALEGTARWVQRGTWSVGGRGAPSAIERGFDGRLLGRATYDTGTQRFVAFELLAVGTRWGGTQYNARHDDLEPAPIGYLFELAGDAPHERVAPAAIWEYGW